MLDIKTLAFTGLRPHKLPWGFNEHDPRCLSLKIVLHDRLAGLIEEENVGHLISGMAMGIDLICAEITLNLKEKYPNITLESAIPFKEQAMLWPKKYLDRYRSVLDKCDNINIISEAYSDDVYENRNRYMVDKCDLLLAVWNGKPGGTGNTITYARKKNKRTIIIDPSELVDVE